MISFISISFFSCSAVILLSSTTFFCDYKYFLCLLFVMFLSFIFQCTISSLLLWKFPYGKFVDSYLLSFLHLLYCQYFVLNLHFCFSFPFHFFVVSDISCFPGWKVVPFSLTLLLILSLLCLSCQ